MSLSKASTRISLFALLLGVIVLSLFGSLIAADRALASADREAVRLDAHGAALVAERELRLAAAKLTELFGPLLPSAASRATAVSSDTTLPSGSFDAVWVLDTRGRVVWRRARENAPRVDSSTVATVARETTPESWPRVRVVTTGDSATGGVLLAVPLSHRD